MDMHSPDHHLTHPKAPPSGALVRRLLNALVAAMPASMRDEAATPEEDRAIAQEMLFAALEPQDGANAQLAAIRIAAGFASMDSFVRAARPGVSEETATRLRASALAAKRACEPVQRAPKPLAEKPPAPPRAPARQEPEPEPAASPPTAPAKVPPGHIALQAGAAAIPIVETFQPRDRCGQPIPPHRVDLMSRAQLLAALASPRDPTLEAAALAEEEAMIAEEGTRNRETAPAE